MTFSSTYLQAESVLKIRLAYKLPLDPIKTQTMADYDLSLILGKTLFEYDDARDAISGVIEKWKFSDNDGRYTFEISKDAKWFDGSPVTAEQIVFNLNRPIKLKSTFGKTLSETVKLDSAKVINESAFSIETIDKKPQKSFFQRVGSVF